MDGERLPGKMFLAESETVFIALFDPPAPGDSILDISAPAFVQAGHTVKTYDGDIKSIRYHKEPVGLETEGTPLEAFLIEHHRIAEVLGYVIEEDKVFDLEVLKKQIAAKRDADAL
jgi:hypothetical protein